MMPAIDRAALAVSHSLAVSIIVKAAVVLSLALILARLARGCRAAIRHAILATGFAVLLALPIAAIIAPPIHVLLPAAQPSPAPADLWQSLDPGSVAQTSKNSSPSRSRTLTFSFFDLLFGVWAIGAAIFLVPVLIGLWQVRSLRCTGLPWSRGLSVARTLAREAGLGRPVEVLLDESVAGPMTCGVFRPTVLFPVPAESWSDGDVNRAVAHELAHIRRADWITHCLARIICAAYWLVPLVWIAWRQLTLEAERACDDTVLSHSEATAYAEQLVALARQLSASHKSPLLAMANRSDLAKRVSAVLDNHQRRGRAGLFPIALLGAIAVLLIITISPLKLSAGARSGAQVNGASLPSFEVASVKLHQPGDREVFPEFLIGGRFTEAGVPLQLIIAVAYSLPVQSPQLSGGPDWIRSNEEAYDIDAKADDGALKGLSAKESDEKMRLMLQSLLADRFKLMVRRELKQQPVYLLTVAKNGPKLQKSKFDEQACADPTALCGAGGVGQGRGIHLKATTVADMVFRVNNYTDRPLLDRSGLTGLYDIDTGGWVPMRGGPRPAPQPAPGPEAEALADPSRPTLPMIFSELGLKMEPSEAMVESFTIEHVDRPTSN